MKISVITPCFNSAATIRDTIESVLSQDYANIEYIIIDGGSKDDTLSIIEEYKCRISKVVSERDDGIYDAMNKGIAVAGGDVIAILNSDDFYADCSVLSQVASLFKSSEVDTVYGDLDYVDSENISKIVRRWRAGKRGKNAFRFGWHPPHPSFFVKKELYEKFGVFRQELRISADYEFMLRLLYVHKISSAYLASVLVKMRTGGASGGTINARKKAYVEDKKAWELNALKAPIGALELKRVRKIIQWF